MVWERLPFLVVVGRRINYHMWPGRPFDVAQWLALQESCRQEGRIRKVAIFDGAGKPCSKSAPEAAAKESRFPCRNTLLLRRPNVTILEHLSSGRCADEWAGGTQPNLAVLEGTRIEFVARVATSNFNLHPDDCFVATVVDPESWLIWFEQVSLSG